MAEVEDPRPADWNRVCYEGESFSRAPPPSLVSEDADGNQS